MVPGTCFAAPVQVACNGNGNVKLPYGSQQYLGLGLVVFVCLVFIELFGSPFMKNAEVGSSLCAAVVVLETGRTGLAALHMNAVTYGSQTSCGQPVIVTSCSQDVDMQS